MLGLGGAAVIVGLPPTGAKASFEPLVLAEAAEALEDLQAGGVLRTLLIP